MRRSEGQRLRRRSASSTSVAAEASDKKNETRSMYDAQPSADSRISRWPLSTSIGSTRKTASTRKSTVCSCSAVRAPGRFGSPYTSRYACRIAPTPHAVIAMSFESHGALPATLVTATCTAKQTGRRTRLAAPYTARAVPNCDTAK